MVRELEIDILILIYIQFQNFNKHQNVLLPELIKFK